MPFLVDDKSRTHAGARFAFTVPKKPVIKILKGIPAVGPLGRPGRTGQTRTPLGFGADVHHSGVLLFRDLDENIASQRLALGADRLGFRNQGISGGSTGKSEREQEHGY